MQGTYYDVLEIHPSASRAQVKAAYRALAKKYHPDRNAGNQVAEERFKAINAAYEVLYHPDKRYWYDIALQGPIILPAPGPCSPKPPPDDTDFYFDKAADVAHYKWKMAATIILFALFMTLFLIVFWPEPNYLEERSPILLETPYGWIKVLPTHEHFETFKEVEEVMKGMKEGDNYSDLYLDSLLKIIRIESFK
jgi:curved DNA-binding protein CbpA